MIAARSAILVAALMLGACASPDSGGLDRQRSVFHNPFGPPGMDQRGIGPQCDEDIGRDMTCLGGPVVYPGRGRVVLLGNGQTMRLTRAQRQFLRDRAALLEALDRAPPPPAPPPAPPPPEHATTRPGEAP